MADGFVYLQAELAAIEQESAGFFRTLRGGMERNGFFRHARSVTEQIERFDELVSCKLVLTAKTIWI